MEAWESPLWVVLDRSIGWVSWDEIEMLFPGGFEEVRAHLVRLAQEGFSIEEDPTKGCRILDRPDRLFPPWMHSDLGTRIFGRSIYYAHTMDSTQEEASRRLKEGAPEGTTVLCEYQRKGRGRRGRRWHSAACSNVTMSVLVRASELVHETFVWTQIASLAVAEAVEPYIHSRVWIKWPNDLYVKGRKLCGILADRELTNTGEAFVVVGVGLNVRSVPDGLAEAICLMELTNDLPRRVPLAQGILRRFEWWCQAFRRHGSEVIWRPWIQRSWLLGKRVRIEEEGQISQGKVEGFLPDGRLMLLSEDAGRGVFAVGDVTVLQLISQGEEQA